MVAVAAEAVSRLLFFGLAREPELLARLFVLYFEKGSAADPTFDRSGEEGGEEEEEVAGIDRDAKAIGSSVRLSQVGWAWYFVNGLFGQGVYSGVPEYRIWRAVLCDGGRSFWPKKMFSEWWASLLSPLIVGMSSLFILQR